MITLKKQPNNPLDIDLSKVRKGKRISYIPLTKTKRASESNSHSNRKHFLMKDFPQLNIFTNSNRMLNTKAKAEVVQAHANDKMKHFHLKDFHNLLSPDKINGKHQKPLKLQTGMDFIESFAYKRSIPSQNNKYNLKEVKSTSHLVKLSNYTPSASKLALPQKDNANCSLNKKLYERRLRQYYSTNKAFRSLENILTNNPNETSMKKRSQLLCYVHSDSFSKKTRSDSYINKVSSSVLSTRLSKVSFILKTNWGNCSTIGLRGIKLFDTRHKEIEIIKGQLADSTKDCFDPKQMLFTFMSHHQAINSYEDMGKNNNSSLRVEVYYDIDRMLSSIELWNYSGEDVSIGVKTLDIVKDSKTIWSGIIPQGYQLDSKSIGFSIEPSLVINLQCHTIRKIIVNKKGTPPASKRVPLNDTSVQRNKAGLPVPLSTNSCDYQQTSKQLKQKQKNSEDNSTFSKTAILPSNNIIEKEKDSVQCNRIKFVLETNYGSSKLRGLPWIELVDVNDKAIGPSMYKAVKANLPSFILNENKAGDCNGVNLLSIAKGGGIGFSVSYEGCHPYIEVVLCSIVNIRAISLWNYNSQDQLEVGIRNFSLFFYNDNQLAHRSLLLLRKAPGEEGLDYSQTFRYPFDSNECSISLSVYNQPLQFLNSPYSKRFETPYLPSGLIVKVLLLSSWGDENSIGLNALELYNQKEEIVLPYKAYLLPDKTKVQDISQPFIGQYINLSKKGLNKAKGSLLLLMFDSPISLSLIKLINYAAEPTKGVKQMTVLMDDCIIYEGECSKTVKEASMPNETIVPFQAIELFHLLQINSKHLQRQPLNLYENIKVQDSHILRLKP